MSRRSSRDLLSQPDGQQMEEPVGLERKRTRSGYRNKEKERERDKNEAEKV